MLKLLIALSTFGLLLIHFNIQANDLFPAHVEVRLGDSGDNFYRVMMDDDENPYLAIDNAAIYLFEMIGECHEQRCHYYLPRDHAKESPPFILDLNDNQCMRGNALSSAITPIWHESVAYLQWREIEKCFPVSIDWYMDLYQINIERHFDTRKELEQRIIKLKENSRQQANELKRMKAQPIQSPSSQMGLASRLSISYGVDQERNVGYSTLSDTLFTSDNTTAKLSLDSREPMPVVYYNIAVETNEQQGILEFGHVLLDSGVFTPNKALEDGIYYTNRKRKPEFGTLQIENTTQPNINIDVLVNGIYRNSYRSDAFGRFVIEEPDIQAGDTVTFRYFLGQGIWQEEQITVAGLDDAFLPPGEWSTQIVAAFEATKIAATAVEYGLADYFTVGTSLFYIDSKPILGLQARYLPTPWLAGHVGWLPEFNRVPIEIDALFSQGQSLSLKLNQSDSLTQQDTPYHSVKYTYAQPTYTVNLDFNHQASGIEFEPRLSARIHQNLFLSYQGFYSHDFEKHQDLYKHSLEMTKSAFSDFSWSIRGEWDDSGRYQSSAANVRYACQRCWLTLDGLFEETSLDFSASETDDEVDYFIGLEAQVTPHLKVRLEADNNQYDLEVTTEFAAKTNFTHPTTKLIAWNHYSASTLKGKVVDQLGRPIRNVPLQVQHQHAISDENGEFYFEHVPAQQNLSIQIDESALELNLTPLYNPVLVNTRQIGITEVVIEMESSFGIDGSVNAALDPNRYIHFKHMERNIEHSSHIEEDGFYMLEGLISGNYLVTLEIGAQEYVLGTFLESDYWISGMNFDINDFEQIH